jgi:REP-associated tyrosine transposase
MFPAWPANLACTCPRAYLGEEALAWLTTDWVLGQFGATVGVARRRYAQFIEAGRSEGHSEVFYGGVADSRVVGEEDFVQAMLKRPRREKPPHLTAIEAYVCEQYALTRQALRAEGRSRLPAEARALLAWLAVKSKASTLANLARYVGRDISTLSHALSRLEERSRNSPGFASTLNQHLYALSQA